MTLKKFSTEIKRLGGTIDLEGTEFNTNNGWGFGGGIGKDHVGNIRSVNFVFRKGTAYFRHLSPAPFSNVRLKEHESAKFDPEAFLGLISDPTIEAEGVYAAWRDWRFPKRRQFK